MFCYLLACTAKCVFVGTANTLMVVRSSLSRFMNQAAGLRRPWYQRHTFVHDTPLQATILHVPHRITFANARWRMHIGHWHSCRTWCNMARGCLWSSAAKAVAQASLRKSAAWLPGCIVYIRPSAAAANAPAWHLSASTGWARPMRASHCAASGTGAGTGRTCNRNGYACHLGWHIGRGATWARNIVRRVALTTPFTTGRRGQQLHP